MEQRGQLTEVGEDVAHGRAVGDEGDDPVEQLERCYELRATAAGARLRIDSRAIPATAQERRLPDWRCVARNGGIPDLSQRSSEPPAR